MEDGIIIINKPKNCTSHDIVAKIKRITHKKVGHTGTLDPLAQGVLPVLIGKGTLCSKYLINHDKIYEVTIQLGKTTETLDEEGEVIKEEQVDSKIYEEQFLKDTLKSFIGKSEQVPPIYSAIKVNGKKLYEYARKGQEVEIKPREIVIYNIELLKVSKELNQVQLKVECGKGTYIRSLCADIAAKLGTIGYMKELKRTKVGIFSIENSINVSEQITEEQIIKNIIDIEQIFKDKPEIEVENSRIQHFLNGVKISVKEPEGVYRVYEKSEFIGIGIVKDKLLKRDIIL